MAVLCKLQVKRISGVQAKCGLQPPVCRNSQLNTNLTLRMCKPMLLQTQPNSQTETLTARASELQTVLLDEHSEEATEGIPLTNTRTLSTKPEPDQKTLTL